MTSLNFCVSYALFQWAIKAFKKPRTLATLEEGDKSVALYNAGVRLTMLSSIVFIASVKAGHFSSNTTTEQAQKKALEVCYKSDVAHFELFWIITNKLAKLVLDGHIDFPGFDTAGISSIKSDAERHLAGIESDVAAMEARVFPSLLDLGDHSLEDQDQEGVLSDGFEDE